MNYCNVWWFIKFDCLDFVSTKTEQTQLNFNALFVISLVIFVAYSGPRIALKTSQLSSIWPKMVVCKVCTSKVRDIEEVENLENLLSCLRMFLLSQFCQSVLETWIWKYKSVLELPTQEFIYNISSYQWRLTIPEITENTEEFCPTAILAGTFSVRVSRRDLRQCSFSVRNFLNDLQKFTSHGVYVILLHIEVLLVHRTRLFSPMLH